MTKPARRTLEALILAVTLLFAGEGFAAAKKKVPAAAKTSAKKKPVAKKSTRPAPKKPSDTGTSSSALTSNDAPAAPARKGAPGETVPSFDPAPLPEPLRRKTQPLAETEPGDSAEPSESGVARRFQGEATATTSLLELSAGLHVFRRDFSYDASPGRSLRPYRLDLAPAPAIEVAFYPGGRLIEGLPANFGLAFSYERAFGLASVVANSSGAVTFPTTTQALQLGAQGRYGFDRVLLTGRLGYGLRSFTISDAVGQSKPLVPSVSYGHVVAQGGARFTLTDSFLLEAGLGFRGVLSRGELATDSYFPGASGNGLTASFGLVVPVAGLEAKLGFELERYSFALHQDAPDLATSAVDQFVGVRFSIGYRT